MAHGSLLASDEDARIRRCSGCGRFQVEFGNAVLMMRLEGLRALHQAVRGALGTTGGGRSGDRGPRRPARDRRPESDDGSSRVTLIQVGEGMGVRFGREELLRIDGLLACVLRTPAEA